MTMINEELERRARKLCEMRGLDPEIKGPLWRGVDTGTSTQIWRHAAEELRAWDQCRRVMEEPLPERELKEGDRVRHTEGGYTGKVLAVEKDSRGRGIALVELNTGPCSAIHTARLERIA